VDGVTELPGHAVELDANLSRSRDKQAGLRWPIALDAKLDRLLDAATDAGERTNRKEIVAALLAAADHDGPALGEIIRAYRTMKVRDALPAQPHGARVVELAHHRPGPRAR
jgi:hypothetical protein